MNVEPDLGHLFDPEEEDRSPSRRPSPKVLMLMAVTGLVIVVIAVAAGISALTDKGTDEDPVSSVRVGGPTISATTTTAATETPTTQTSASAAPTGSFEAELASRKGTVPRLDELSDVEARGYGRTMCLRLDSHVPETDIVKEAADNGLNPDVAAAILELAKKTICPDEDDPAATDTP